MRGSLPNVNRLVQALQNHGPTIAEEMAVRVAAHAPVGTRDYATAVKDSIHGESEPTAQGVRLTVVADLPDGTYPIDPVVTKALFWPGAEHPVRHVEHPFRVPSALGDESKNELDQIIEDEWPLILADVSTEA